MATERIYSWRKMHRSPAPSIAPGTFFAVQFSADYTISMSVFDLRQAQRTFVPVLLSIPAVETYIKINFREILVSFAFRLLQQYLPTADLR
jgi:hypothetical protein